VFLWQGLARGPSRQRASAHDPAAAKFFWLNAGAAQSCNVAPNMVVAGVASSIRLEHALQRGAWGITQILVHDCLQTWRPPRAAPRNNKNKTYKLAAGAMRAADLFLFKLY
jgi:hypothetical protein